MCYDRNVDPIWIMLNGVYDEDNLLTLKKPEETIANFWTKAVKKSTMYDVLLCERNVHPIWIESLNSVLHHDHLLTLSTGERIACGDLNFTHDCKFASIAPNTPNSHRKAGGSDKIINIMDILKANLIEPSKNQLLNMETIANFCD